MRNGFVYIAISIAIMSSAGTALAQVYSFESPAVMPDGFFGLGATVTRDTIGATHLANSLKYEVGAGGFVGARTETVIPAALNDPPGVAAVLFDMTINTPYAGTFADIGVTVFGHALNAPGARAVRTSGSVRRYRANCRQGGRNVQKSPDQSRPIAWSLSCRGVVQSDFWSRADRPHHGLRISILYQ